MIYEYLCEIHGTFEIQQSVKELPLDRCPTCVEEQITEYHCNACDTKWLPANEAKPSNCIKCDSQNITAQFPKPKKLISASNFVLRGGGWAREGYNK